MRKLLLSFAPLFLLLVITSCQKEISSGDDNTPGSNSYLPLTAGSKWRFKDSASNEVSLMTALNITKSSNNRTYRAVLDSATTDTTYMAQAGANYYILQDDATTGLIDIHFLNDTAASGHTWQTLAGQFNGMNLNSKGKIVAKNVPMTVEGKNYNNVIHSEVRLVINLFGTEIEVVKYDFYLAKGIGIIRTRMVVQQQGTIVMKETSNLISHHIQP